MLFSSLGPSNDQKKRATSVVVVTMLPQVYHKIVLDWLRIVVVEPRPDSPATVRY
jgi:hypothetical protein